MREIDDDEEEKKTWKEEEEEVKRKEKKRKEKKRKKDNTDAFLIHPRSIPFGSCEEMDGGDEWKGDGSTAEMDGVACPLFHCTFRLAAHIFFIFLF